MESDEGGFILCLILNASGFISHGCNAVSMVAVTAGLNGRFSKHKAGEGDVVHHLCNLSCVNAKKGR